MGTIDKGPCKIAAFSGYTGDRFDALKTQAEGSGAPILFGDYLAEMVSTQWGWEVVNWGKCQLHQLQLL